MKIIELLIDPRGNAQLQTKGFEGASCKEGSKAIEKALGIVRSDIPTAELYNIEQPQQRQQQRS